MSNSEPASTGRDFIRQMIDEDNRTGKHAGRVHTRFPPEPNGYLHIGHAKSICLNFGIAAEYGGKCNLRFDDTNPVKESQEYIDSIVGDVRWLGFDWEDRLLYSSDYFGRMYDYAEQLIEQGDAYVDDCTARQISEQRGDVTTHGTDSPYRNRTVEENLDLFRRMRDGEFADGEKVLRAKIDMTHPNMLMRDPIMYRILHASHPHVGDRWCIYPMYDWAHGLEDSIEGITHSICTLEFEVHRQLYDWFLDRLGVYHPRQIEFARLNLTYTVMSKRILLDMVEGVATGTSEVAKLAEGGHVTGWDDPRMPTISGMRRRGYPPAAIRDFCSRIGVAKKANTIAFELLEHCVRQELNRTANRFMAVLRPLKVVITNYLEDQSEEFKAVNNPEDPSAGTRLVPFSRELYIEQEDFMEEPVKRFFRLAPGREVRLRYAYFITCQEAIKDEKGNVIELRCTYDPETRGGDAPDGRKVKATLHWVSAAHALNIEARLFDKLFTVEDPMGEKGEFTDYLNPDSLEILTALAEPAVASLNEGDRIQFERTGYFSVDPDSTPDKMVFNRTSTLRDTWAKVQKQNRPKGKRR